MPEHEGHIVVKTNELPQNPNPISPQDIFILWSSGEGKTYGDTISRLGEYFGTGGGGTGTPGNVAAKGWHHHDITAGQVGSNTVLLPQFAGKNFTLFQEGRAFKDSEYTVLDAGGFTIDIPGFQFNEAGQRYSLNFAVPIVEGTPDDPQVIAGGFITAIKPVNVNTTLAPTDVNCVIQIRGGTSQITLTLPDVAVVKEYSFLIIETAISTASVATISTSEGQMIYMDGGSHASLSVHSGESVCIYRTSEGWYVWNNFGEIYRSVGDIKDALKVGNNQLELRGQAVEKAKYPRLWKFAQSSALVPDSSWSNNKGCFADINDTLFRLPDFRDMFTRTAGTGRAIGSYQADQFAIHSHGYAIPTDGRPGQGNRMSVVDSDNADEGLVDYTTTAVGGDETRPKNIALLKVIRY